MKYNVIQYDELPNNKIRIINECMYETNSILTAHQWIEEYYAAEIECNCMFEIPLAIRNNKTGSIFYFHFLQEELEAATPKYVCDSGFEMVDDNDDNFPNYAGD